MIALSGGKDSALCLLLAWRYAKQRADVRKGRPIDDIIACYSMPTQYNSAETRSIAAELAQELGVAFDEYAIQTLYGETWTTIHAMTQVLPTGVADQNIQARVRGSIIMDIANATNGFVLQTSNMTEKSVGYATYGGDMLGGYSPLGNVPKTVVIELLQYLSNEYQLPSLKKLLATKASAELAANQTDENDYMPFPVWDDCLALFGQEKLDAPGLYLALRAKYSDEALFALASTYRRGMLKLWVKKFVIGFCNNIFKWVQSPPAAHVGTLDLDSERALQLPMAKSYEWLHLEALRDLPD